MSRFALQHRRPHRIFRCYIAMMILLKIKNTATDGISSLFSFSVFPRNALCSRRKFTFHRIVAFKTCSVFCAFLTPSSCGICLKLKLVSFNTTRVVFGWNKQRNYTPSSSWRSSAKYHRVLHSSAWCQQQKESSSASVSKVKSRCNSGIFSLARSSSFSSHSALVRLIQLDVFLLHFGENTRRLSSCSLRALEENETGVSNLSSWNWIISAMRTHWCSSKKEKLELNSSFFPIHSSSSSTVALVCNSNAIQHRNRND